MRLALFGSPAKHSLSPAMHRAALATVGIDGDYIARDVDSDRFSAGMGELRDGRLDGANVTMPYKRTAYDLVDDLGNSARRVGAVNAVVVGDDGSLVGENTDVDGVQASFEVAGLPKSDPVVILGAGGAASAALVALHGRPIYVVARSPGTARRNIAQVDAEATVITWGDPIPAGVVVNATSLGMRGEALPAELISEASGLLDMPYRDTPTPSVVLFRKRGLPVADGLDMLVGQATACFRMWTGRQVPAAIFRNAAEQELLKRARGATRTPR